MPARPAPPNQIGEVNANLAALLPGGEPSFQVHSDSAPTVYVNGNPPRTDAALRKLERDVAATKAVDPYVSAAPTPITRFLVDPVAEQTLHMVNADPRRTPTFTLFANPDYFLSTFNCPAAGGGGPICIDYHFAWSHGDVDGRHRPDLARPGRAGRRATWARRAASGPTTPTCARRCSRCSG